MQYLFFVLLVIGEVDKAISSISNQVDHFVPSYNHDNDGDGRDSQAVIIIIIRVIVIVIVRVNGGPHLLSPLRGSPAVIIITIVIIIIRVIVIIIIRVIIINVIIRVIVCMFTF